MDRQTLFDDGFATTSVLELELLRLPPEQDDEPAFDWFADAASEADDLLSEQTGAGSR